MAQLTGSITLNGVSDQQLVTVMEVKARHPQMSFSPQSIQPFNEGTPTGNVQRYNAVTFGFTKQADIEAIQEILSKLSG